MEILPRPFGDNLTAWFKILGRQWKPLLYISLLGFVPAALFTLVLFGVTDVFSSFEPLFDEELVESLSNEEIWEILGPFFWTIGIWAVLMTIPTAFVYLAAARVVGESLNDRDASLSGVVAVATRRLAKALVGGIALTILVSGMLGAAGLVAWWLFDTMDVSIPSVFFSTATVLTAVVLMTWLGLACSLYTQAIAFEDAGAVESLSRSFRLVRERWWVTLGFLVVVALISSAVAQVLSAALFPVFFFALTSPWIFGVAYALITLVQGPVAAAIGAAYGIWYVDLRARKETVLISDLLG